MISVNQEIGTSFPENWRRERDMIFLIEDETFERGSRNI